MTTPRERYNAVMNFEEPDKLPWSERWHPNEWLPLLGNHIDIRKVAKGSATCGDRLSTGFSPVAEIDDIKANAHFGFMRVIGLGDPIDMCPIPRFPPKRKETEEYIEWNAGTGVKVRLSKRAPNLWYSMPYYRDWPVKGRDSWKEYKERLDYGDIRRYPKDWDPKAYRRIFKEFSEGSTRVVFNGFYGFGAQLMGIDRFNKTFYNDSKLIQDMAGFWEEYIIGLYEPFLDACGEYVDATYWWEDMAERHGPFISPKLYEEYLTPHYKRVVEFLNKKGVDRIMMESDGNLHPILDQMIEAGINGLHPLEVNAGNDARKIREEYGEKIWLQGNLDKRLIAEGGKKMREEVDRGVELANEIRGYIPSLDHDIPGFFTYEILKEYSEYMKKKLSYSENPLSNEF